MKTFLKRFALFIPFVIIIYVVQVIMWGSFAPEVLKKNLNYVKGGPGFMYSRLNEVKNYKDVDLLIVGSSHAYRGFDTRIFEKNGLKTFNLGSSSQTPIQTETLLKEYLDVLNPKTVIIEVYPYILSSDGVESSLDLVSNSQSEAYTAPMALEQYHIKVLNTLIFSYYRKLFNKDKSFTETPKKENDEYIQGGYVERKIDAKGNDTMNTALMLKDKNVIESKTGKWTPNKKQLDAFERILKMLKDKNIKTILIQAPITSAYYTQIKSMKEIDNYLSSKGTYYNFNEILKLNDKTDFLDHDHLNSNGVKIFNDYILKNILNKP